MSAARHLEDLAEELSTRKAAGERTLKVWGHRRGLTLPDVRSLARQLVAQGRMIEGEGPGGLVWRPTERRTLDLPPLEIETGEPSSRSAPLVTPRNPTSFEGPKPEVLQEAEEEPIMPAGAAEPCQRCEYLRLQLNAPCQECERLRQERDVAQGEAHGLRQQLQEVSAERDEARARCAAWEQEADHAYRQLCRAADLGEGSPLSSILDRVRLLVAVWKATPEPEEEPPPQAPAPSPRSLFGGLTPEARRTVADVLGELAAHLEQFEREGLLSARGPGANGKGFVLREHERRKATLRPRVRINWHRGIEALDRFIARRTRFTTAELIAELECSPREAEEAIRALRNTAAIMPSGEGWEVIEGFEVTGQVTQALIHWFARLVIEAPQPLTPEQWAPLVELDRNLVVALAHLAIKAKKIKATPAGALVAVPEKKGKK